MPVVAPTTDVSSAPLLTWHFPLHWVPPFWIFFFLSPAPVWGKWSAEEFGAAVCALPARGARLFLLLRRLPGWAAVHAAEIPAAGEQRAHWLPWKTPEQVGNTKWYRKGKWTQQASAHTLWKIIRIYIVSVYLSLLYLTIPPPVLHQPWRGSPWVFSTWWCLQYSVLITKTATLLRRSLRWDCVLT